MKADENLDRKPEELLHEADVVLWAFPDNGN